MTRAVWVDANNDAAYAKYPARGISAPYFDPRDPRVTPAYLNGVKMFPGIEEVGLYFAWNWYPPQSASALAQTISNAVKQVGWFGNPPVCIDIEKGHGLDDGNYAPYVTAFFQRWRQLRPTRATAYTLEGFQGGLFSARNVSILNAANLRVCPQLYAGDMTPLGHSPIIDLLIAGFDGARLDGMYDAADLPYSWRGFAFTQGRLP